MKKFAIEYRHKGKTYHMLLEAENHQDATERLRSAYYNGEPLERVASLNIPNWMTK